MPPALVKYRFAFVFVLYVCQGFYRPLSERWRRSFLHAYITHDEV